MSAGRILQMAIKKAVEILKSPKKTGTAVGSTFVAGYGIRKAYEYYVSLRIPSQSKNDEEDEVVKLTKVCDICYDKYVGFNTQDQGDAVAAVYQDQVGNFHKNVGSNWYIWNGYDWI